MGEQFDQQSARDCAADDMGALHPSAHCLDGVCEIEPRIVGQAIAAREQPGRLLRRELRQQLALLVLHGRVREEDQFLGVERRRRCYRYIFHGEVEDLACGRITHWRYDRYVAGVQAPRDCCASTLRNQAVYWKSVPACPPIRRPGMKISRTLFNA